MRLPTRRSLLLACLPFALACDCGSVPSGEGRAVVGRYDYHFDLRTGEARTSLMFDVLEPGPGCTPLESALVVDDVVTARGLRLVPDGASLALCGSFPVDGSSALSGRVFVPESTPFGGGIGLSRTPDASSHVFAYLLGWLEACPLFGPCDPAPERLAHFTFDVEHDVGDVVLCPGERTASPGRTHCEVLGTRAPTYSTFAILSNPAWVQAPLVTAAGVSVVMYEVPGGDVTAALPPDAVGAFLDFVTTRLGPFPYGKELRVATGPTSWLGMEHPANVVLSESLPSEPVPYENPTLHVLLHEIAHQWAGNRTTLANVLDYAWKEAASEYLVYVFEDTMRPAAEAERTRRYWVRAGRFAGFPVRPVDRPALHPRLWTPSVYGSGPMTLFLQLESMLGRDVVLDALAAFLAEPGARSVRDLRTALELASGADLGPYFDAWVFGSSEPEWPAFHASTERTGDTVTVTLTQSHSGGRLFPCVVEVEIHGTHSVAKVAVDFGLAPVSATATAAVPFADDVVDVVIDPDDRVLDWTTSPAAFSAEPPIRWHP